MQVAKNIVREQSKEKAPEKRSDILPFAEVSSKSDVNKIYPHVQALAEEYEAMKAKIENIHKSMEEQYATMAPVLIREYKKLFFKRHMDDEKMENAVEAFFDLADTAIAKAGDEGDLLPEDAAEINRILAEVKSYYDDLSGSLKKFRGSPAAETGGSESFEEFHLKTLEADINEGKKQLLKCQADYQEIINSEYKDLFGEDFMDRLYDHKTLIKLLEGMIEFLENTKDAAKSKLAKDGITDEEVERIVKNLTEKSAGVRKHFTSNIARLERGIDTLKEDLEAERVKREKEIEEARAEQEKLSARLDELAGRLKERAKKKFFVVADGKTAVREMLERIKTLKGGVLSADLVGEIEREAQEKIIGPEEKSDLEHEKMTAIYKGGPRRKEEGKRTEQEKMELIYKVAPRVVAEKKQIDEMIGDFEKAEKYFGKTSGKERRLLDETGTQLSYALQRNDFLRDALDPKTNSSLEVMNSELEEYDKVFPGAVKLHDDLLSETKKAAFTDLLKKVVQAMPGVNKNILPTELAINVENCSRAIERDREMSLEEMEEYAAQLDQAIALVGAMKREDMKKSETHLDDKKAKIEIERKAEASAAAATEAPVAKKEIKKSAREMLAEEGVINISPDQILGLFKKEELDFLVKGVSADVTEGNDSNRDEFIRALRGAVKERLLSDLDKTDREALAESVPLQVYSLLRDAVRAESDKEILRLQTAEAGKLAAAGKVGAKLLANVGLYAGIGVGAGMAIGSGGAAFAVTAIAVPLARKAIKHIGESEIFKKQKEAAGSLWGKSIGRLFKKEQPLVDAKKSTEETVKKVASAELLASILANQMRENSSRELLAAIRAYGENKKEAMRKASPETAAKFEQSLDQVSREFYKNAYNYLAMSHSGENLSEEILSQMALMMTQTIGMHQRGEVAVAGAMAEAEKKADMPEDKNWMVDKVEHFLKFNSEGIGAAVFGGSMAVVVSRSTTTGRVASGVLAGAGLGLMVEKKIKRSEKEKPLAEVEKIISENEKKFVGRESDISDDELDKAKQDMVLVKARLDAGELDGSEQFSLRNRAKNFIAQINRLTVERYEARGLGVDELLKDISRQTQAQEKAMAKTAKKLLKVFGTKNRELVFMLAGGTVGGVLGYLGARLTEYLRAPTAETIMPAEHGLGAAGHERFVDYNITPLEHHAPAVPEQAAEEAIAPKAPPVHEHALRHVAAPEKIVIAKPAALPAEPGSFDEWFDSATKNIIRPKGMPAEDFETIMRHLPKNRITEEQYHHMIDVYTKAGMPEAEKYITLVEQGKIVQAEKLHHLIDFLDEERDIIVRAAKQHLADEAK